MDTGFNLFEPQPHLMAEMPADPPPTPPRRRRRLLLLASAALVTVAAAGGAFLLSPYNHVAPVDTGRLGAQVRQLATSALAGLNQAPLVAPAAKLATASRPAVQPVTRAEVPSSDSDALMRELLALRSGSDAHSGDMTAGAAVKEAGQTGDGPSPSPSPTRLPVAAAAPIASPAAEVGAPSVSRPAALPQAALAPVPPPSGSAGMEPGMPASAPQSAAPAAVAPAPLPAATAAVEAAGGTDAADTTDTSPQEQPASGAPVRTTSMASALPATTPLPPSGATTPPPADPVATAIAMQPNPMTRSEQIDVLHLVAQMGIVMRDLRIENAALRAGTKASSDKVDNAVADFERRLALAESRGAVNAAMGDVEAPDATPALAPPPLPTSRTARLSGGPTPQAPSPQLQSSVSAGAGGPRRYKVQAASPHLAMLSELDRSGGEGSQLQVGVGDQVPGYGRVSAIQQQGVAWIVKTDHGSIQ